MKAMAWNEQESQPKESNPIEGALGKFMAIVISVVALAVSQTRPPLWLILVLLGIVIVSALMMLRSPFSAFFQWLRDVMLRRRMKHVYLARLVRLSAVVERL